MHQSFLCMDLFFKRRMKKKESLEFIFKNDKQSKEFEVKYMRNFQKNLKYKRMRKT